MRIPLAGRKRGTRFNITPLIDVIFLLIIFFLVASHFARTDPTTEVMLPAASQTTEDEIPRRLTITVTQDLIYFVKGQQVSEADITAMIREGAQQQTEDYAVRIRGDQQTPYSAIEPIMLACVENGITRFGFHVIQAAE